MVKLWITKGKRMNLAKFILIPEVYTQSYAHEKYCRSNALALVPNEIPQYNNILTTT